MKKSGEELKHAQEAMERRSDLLERGKIVVLPDRPQRSDTAASVQNDSQVGPSRRSAGDR